MRVRLFTDEERWRRLFKRLNRFMLLLWRLRLGRLINSWPSVVGRIMVISHTGRVSGHRYRTPVNYSRIKEAVYCVAAFGSRADWYLNLMANPQVEIWLPDGRWTGTAMEVPEGRERLPVIRQVLIDSGFAAYLAGIWPRRISDEELEAEIAGYRLVRIDLEREVSESDSARASNAI